jgi:membrane-bound lytic murein transglycosylase B
MSKYKILIFISILISSLYLDTQLQAQPHNANNTNNLRGWRHLADLLIERGVEKKEVERLFLDPRMPEFTELFFSVTPRESPRLYTSFFSEKRIEATKKYLQQYAPVFKRAEEAYGIDRRIIAAIILVETNFGTFTGKQDVVFRLARLANASSPENLINNHKRLNKQDPDVTLKQVIDRGKYLEDLFTPQVEAALTIAKNRKIDVFSLKGSSAGAFGIPQFLPLSYLRFAVDGNRDGIISLFQHEDAIMSVGNFLKHYREKAPENSDSLRTAIWEYNRSEPYIDTIIGVAKKLGYKPPIKPRA